MYFKSVFLALGALVLFGLTAGADEAFDACNVEIEGATVLMSADAVAAEWSSRGYVRKVDRRNSGGRGAGPKPIMVQFHMGDNTPSPANIVDLSWGSSVIQTVSMHTLYRVPADPAELAAYSQFVHDTVTAWCAWALPYYGRQGVDFGRATKLSCDRINNGEFVTYPNGVPSLRHGVIHLNGDGCDWKVSTMSNGDMHFAVTRPKSIAD